MVSCVWFPDGRFWVGFFGAVLDQWRPIFLVGVLSTSNLEWKWKITRHFEKGSGKTRT